MNKPLDHQYHVPSQEWNQQPQLQQEGVVVFDRTKATQMAGIIAHEAYVAQSQAVAEVRTAQTGTPEFFRASTVMDRVNSSRARLLRAHQDVERIA